MNEKEFDINKFEEDVSKVDHSEIVSMLKMIEKLSMPTARQIQIREVLRKVSTQKQGERIEKFDF